MNKLNHFSSQIANGEFFLTFLAKVKIPVGEENGSKEEECKIGSPLGKDKG